MAAIRGFGAYLPSRVVTNAELAARLNCEPAGSSTCLELRNGAMRRPDESVASMGVIAAEQCLERAGVKASDLGMILVSSGSSERRFPGPASTIAHALNIDGVPAIDLPIASAGSLFGMALAASLSVVHGNILVIASEKMSCIVSARSIGARRCAPVWRWRGCLSDRPRMARPRSSIPLCIPMARSLKISACHLTLRSR